MTGIIVQVPMVDVDEATAKQLRTEGWKSAEELVKEGYFARSQDYRHWDKADAIERLIRELSDNTINDTYIENMAKSGKHSGLPGDNDHFLGVTHLGGIPLPGRGYNVVPRL